MRVAGSRQPTGRRPSAMAARSAPASQLVRPRAGADGGRSCRKSDPRAVPPISTIGPPIHAAVGPSICTALRTSIAYMSAVQTPAPPAPAAGPHQTRSSGAGQGTAALAGAAGMACVGGSTAVSSVLAGAPLFTAQAVRYALACLLLVAFARRGGRRLMAP